MTTFATLLRTYRERANLSQCKLAERCNMDNSAFSHYESSARRPKRETAAVIADALNLTGEDRADLLRSAGFSEREEPLDPLALAVDAALGKDDDAARMLRRVIPAVLGAAREAVGA